MNGHRIVENLTVWNRFSHVRTKRGMLDELWFEILRGATKEIGNRTVYHDARKNGVIVVQCDEDYYTKCAWAKTQEEAEALLN